jgi:tight adherence protein B
VSGWAAALLLGAAVSVYLGLPSGSALRLSELRTRPAGAARLFNPFPGARPVPSASGSGRSGPTTDPAAGGAARPPAWRSGLALLLLLAGAGSVLLLGVPTLLVLLLVAGVVLARRAAHRRAACRRRERERQRAVEACAALAAELRAGRTAAEALSVAARLATGPSEVALAAASSTAGLGGDVPTVLRAAADAGAPAGQPTAVPELLRGLAACWAVCATSGSGLAAAVERLEEGLRSAADQRRAVQAELAGPRATAAMLAVLPGVGVVLAWGLGADPVGVLLHTPVGQVCLVGGLVLDAAGVAWTGRLVDRAGGAA